MPGERCCTAVCGQAQHRHDGSEYSGSSCRDADTRTVGGIVMKSELAGLSKIAKPGAPKRGYGDGEQGDRAAGSTESDPSITGSENIMCEDETHACRNKHREGENERCDPKRLWPWCSKWCRFGCATRFTWISILIRVQQTLLSCQVTSTATVPIWIRGTSRRHRPRFLRRVRLPFRLRVPHPFPVQLPLVRTPRRSRGSLLRRRILPSPPPSSDPFRLRCR